MEGWDIKGEKSGEISCPAEEEINLARPKTVSALPVNTTQHFAPQSFHSRPKQIKNYFVKEPKYLQSNHTIS